MTNLSEIATIASQAGNNKAEYFLLQVPSLKQNFRSDTMVLNFIGEFDIKYKEVEDVPTNFCGLSARYNDTSVILVNAHFDFLPRKIFTIAHEIGHLFLHSEEKSFYDDVSTIGNYRHSKIEEMEANCFAASLICPESILLYYLENNYSFNDISANLCLSYGTLHWRIYNLLINENQMCSFDAERIVNNFRFNNTPSANSFNRSDGIISSLLSENSIFSEGMFDI